MHKLHGRQQWRCIGQALTSAQIGYTLNLVVQDGASETNQHLLTLTQDTVDDSATVKIITIASAFYLPGSFVAVC